MFRSSTCVLQGLGLCRHTSLNTWFNLGNNIMNYLTMILIMFFIVAVTRTDILYREIWQ
jgi:hypothetical protein